MNPKDILSLFVAKHGALGAVRHTSLCAPFSDESYSYASNGYIMVQVPLIGEYAHIPFPFDSAAEIRDECLSVDPCGVWSDLPNADLKSRQCRFCSGTGYSMVCEECEGHGFVAFDSGFHDYECECQSCRGDGKIPGGNEICDECDGEGRIAEQTFCKFGNRTNFGVDGLLLQKLKLLPEIMINTGCVRDAFVFKFKGGKGVLMGRRYE